MFIAGLRLIGIPSQILSRASLHGVYSGVEVEVDDDDGDERTVHSLIVDLPRIQIETLEFRIKIIETSFHSV